MSQVGSIGVICDKEPAKTMRTDDPRRDNIISAVAEQTALVKEMAASNIHRDMRVMCPAHK